LSLFIGHPYRLAFFPAAFRWFAADHGDARGDR
jgi:hypothetical protein